MIKVNYKIHGSLAAKMADGILEAAGVSDHKEDDGNELDDSCTSEKYYPKHSRKYGVCVSNDDDNQSSSNNSVMKELKEFRRRSIELTKNYANQVSDLRLLSLDCIYLFSEDTEDSISKYLGIEYHIILFNFNDSNNKWMELQAATINMMSEAINTDDKAIVEIANMLHSM
ncbi:hypothetical protein INT48_002098 [Thamnidium elegans]|uniref:Uncharacterized protein n=1 Tax=Thamnidium elegans TaxID=101142 RepID=A0A8H7SFX8_9FUNG|nr:hypothetical protein INT48_002098 [Thamnidium elegans]